MAGIVAGGCAHGYYVNPVGAPSHVACENFALLNGGLSSYLPFDILGRTVTACEQVSPACTKPAAETDGESIPLRPGVRLTIHQFPLAGEGENQLIPALSSFEYVVPSPGGPLSRHDYLFFSYLLSASFPKNPNQLQAASPLKDLAILGKAGTCDERCRPNPGPDCTRSCKEGIVRDAIASLAYSASAATPGVEGPPPWASAAAARWWLNPTPSAAQTDNTHLQFHFGGQERVLFAGWNDAYFAVAPPKVTNGKHGKSDLYTASAGTGRALVEVDIPVRLQPEHASRFVPVYWSIDDLERRFGVTVIGLRRRAEFFSQSLLAALGPKATCERMVAPGFGYYTLWFERRFPWAPKPLGSLGADAYLIAQKPGRKSAPALSTLKKETLLAPGDVLVLAFRRQLTDSPAQR
jgi:hypothetical protein